jgi:transcriptional regulator with XRE-family HTH domain
MVAKFQSRVGRLYYESIYIMKKIKEDKHMEIGIKIQEHREKNRLSQEELADKIGVSRQSVSKWELGQALPEIDKIVALSKLFEITTDELLLTDEGECQSCAMPFKYGKHGTNADGTVNSDYCEHCFEKGKFKYPNATMDGVIDVRIQYIVPHVYPDHETARKAMQEHFPTLKRWAK